MIVQNKIRETFSIQLIDWYRKNKRDLPWRKTTDPYKIWVSEVMLQQTQVDFVLSYYARFVVLFPTIRNLAEASLDHVLKAWEGLGYYARARNLHRAAKQIVALNRSCLPEHYADLLSIRGIGPYTAAAVASIAFGETYAVVDGNVVRVLSRLFKIADVPAKYGRAKFTRLAEQLLPQDCPGDFNQAMMELGALLCTPAAPNCSDCPVNELCEAYRTMTDPSVLPVKAPRKKIPHVDVVVGIVWKEGKVLVKRRPPHGLLGGLWEFPGGKVAKGASKTNCLKQKIKEKFNLKIKESKPFMSVKHAYSHFKITLHAYQCQVEKGRIKAQSIEWKWLSPEELTEYPFPKANKKVLDSILETL